MIHKFKDSNKYNFIHCSGTIETSCVETNIEGQKGYRCTERCVEEDSYLRPDTWVLGISFILILSLIIFVWKIILDRD